MLHESIGQNGCEIQDGGRKMHYTILSQYRMTSKWLYKERSYVIKWE